MIKRSKPHQPQGDDSPDIFEQFGNSIKGGIDRLIQFGEPDSSGELIIDPRIESWLDAFNTFENGDKSKLIALMKSGTPLHPMLLPHLGDLPSAISTFTLSHPEPAMTDPDRHPCPL